jgi:hypothetical protein
MNPVSTRLFGVSIGELVDRFFPDWAAGTRRFYEPNATRSLLSAAPTRSGGCAVAGAIAVT